MEESDTGDVPGPSVPLEGKSGWVTVDGRRVHVLTSRTLLSSMARGSVPVMARSLKYHRRRAPFCGVGQCTGCLVRLNGVPMVEACEVMPKDGDVVETEGGWPSVRHDLLGVMDWVFRDHMDTLHGFTRPSFMRTFYQRVVRRFSGLGNLPDVPRRDMGRARDKEVDILIIGGGTAGMAALGAIEDSHSGLRTLLLDREGGRGCSVVHLPPPVNGGFTALAVRTDEPALLARARAVLVTTGAYDASLMFPGNDIPGVMTAEGALAMRSAAGRFPFRRALLFGGGSRAEEILGKLGSSVSQIVSPTTMAPSLIQMAGSRSIPVVEDQLILSAHGRHEVREVRLRDRRSGDTVSMACDAVVLAHRSLPQASLLFHAGAQMKWLNSGSTYYPVTDPCGATSVPGLFAAGRVAGNLGNLSVTSSALKAARAMVLFLNGTVTTPSGPAGIAPNPDPQLAPSSSGDAMVSYYRDMLDGKELPKTMICACEDVTLSEVVSVLREGWEPSLEVVKRMTGLGMGLCQGRYCLPDAIPLLSAMTGRSPEEIGFITQRPPVWPVLIGDLSGGM